MLYRSARIKIECDFWRRRKKQQANRTISMDLNVLGIYVFVSISLSLSLDLAPSMCLCVLCWPMLSIIGTSLQKSVSNSILWWFVNWIPMWALFKSSNSPMDFFNSLWFMGKIWSRNIRLQFKSNVFKKCWRKRRFSSYFQK